MYMTTTNHVHFIQKEEVVESGFHVFDAFNESEINYILGLVDSKKYLEAKKFQVLITTANDNFKKELEKIEEAKKICIDDGLMQ